MTNELTNEQIDEIDALHAVMRDGTRADYHAALDRFQLLVGMRWPALRDMARANLGAVAEPVAWIPVSERLPDSSWEMVWVYGDDAEGIHQWAACAYVFHDSAWLSKYSVTHWQPLPATPISGKRA